MAPIFDYLDYRAYMKDALTEKKEAMIFLSYRVLAESFDLCANNLFKILQGDAHLPARCQPKVMEFLNLSGRSAEYFLLLVAYGRERKTKARNAILDKAISLREVARHKLVDKEITYMQDWWVSAIRALLGVLLDGRCVPAEISRLLSPPVPEEEVSKALDLLKEVGLVKTTISGRLVLTEAHVTASGEHHTQEVRHLQRQILALAAESLERFPKELRDVSTLTLTVDGPAFSKICDILKESRALILKTADETRKPDRVMQLASAFFPLSHVLSERP